MWRGLVVTPMNDRAQSVQVGAIILFGFVIISLSIYQATVIPNQNTQAEFEQSQVVRGDISELRNGVQETGVTGAPRSVNVRLGTRFPPRTLFVNPPPMSGSLQTVNQTTANLTVVSATEVVTSADNSEFLDYWQNGSREFESKIVVYTGDYRVYNSAANNVSIQFGQVFAGYPGGRTVNVTDTPNLISNDRLTLVLIQGDLSERGVNPATIDMSSNSQISRREVLSGSVNVTIPTTLPPEQVQSLLRDAKSDINVTAADQVRGGQAVRVQLNGTISLGVAAVNVGDDAPEVTPAYIDITRVSNSAGEVTVEVRDQYGNPVTSARVKGTSRDGTETRVQTTDVTGKSTFSFESNVEGAVNFSIGNANISRIDEDTPENASVDIFSSGGNGAAGAGGKSVYSASDPTETYSSAGGRWVNITCTDQLILSNGEPTSRPNANGLQGDVIRLTASLNNGLSERYAVDIKLARSSDDSWNKKEVKIYGSDNNQNANINTDAAVDIFEGNETDILEVSNYDNNTQQDSDFAGLLNQVRELESNAPVVWQTSRATGRVQTTLVCDPPPAPPASGIETKSGTTPDGESTALEFDLQVASNETKTVTDVSISAPSNQNSNADSSVNKLNRGGQANEVRLSVSNGKGVNSSGNLNQTIQLDGIKNPLDSNATVSNGAVLSVDMGDLKNGNVDWKYNFADSSDNADVIISFYLADGTKKEVYLRVTNVNS